MSLYCDTPLGDYTEDICQNNEGRIIAVALLRVDHGITDLTSLAQWNAAILAGSVEIIRNVSGEMPKSAPITGDGFGRQQTRNISRDHTSSYQHPDVIGNENFYNNLNYNNSYSYYPYTASGHIWSTGDAIASFDAAPIIEKGLNSSIIFDVAVSWSDKDIPVAYDATTLATLFEV